MKLEESVQSILKKHNIEDDDLAAALTELLELADTRAHRVTRKQVDDIDSELAKRIRKMPI